MKTIAIIGGGAAGLSAAVTAGEASQHCAVIRIYEASDRVGRSILATGNGRCNFSNAHIDPALYHNSDYVSECLAAVEQLANLAESPNGVVAFFENHGLAWREEGEGRLYPQANKASSVLDVLRASAKAAGVEERLETKIDSIDLPRESGKPFTLRTSEGVFERADAVIVACGGRTAQKMLPPELCVSYLNPMPVLCPIATKTREVRELDNIRVKANVSLLRKGSLVASERGEVLFRKYGVSGIAIFNLSRIAQPDDVLSIDLFPDVDSAAMTDYLSNRRRALASIYGEQMTCADFMRGLLLPRVSEVLLARCDADEAKPFDAAIEHKLAVLLKGFDFEVAGLAEPDRAQVHRGGFEPYAFNPCTLESLAQPGLFVTGEALDVDGPCGGYNLHWAFATGILAGRHSAACL